MPDSYELCVCYKFVKHSEGMGRFARFLDKSRYIDFFVFSLFFVLFYIEVSGSVVKNYHTFKVPKSATTSGAGGMRMALGRGRGHLCWWPLIFKFWD